MAPRMIEVDNALKKLERRSPRAVRALELHYFGGMSVEEIAGVFCIAVSTADGRFASLVPGSSIKYYVKVSDSKGEPRLPRKAKTQ